MSLRINVTLKTSIEYLKNTVTTGFIFQLVSTVLARIMYIILISEISTENTSTSNINILILSYSAVAASFFSLSSMQFVFSYFRTDGVMVVDACIYQLTALFAIASILFIFVLIFFLFGINSYYVIIGLSVLLIGVILAQAEVIYAIYTGQSSKLKGVIYQGVPIILYMVYYLCVRNDMDLMVTVIFSSLACIAFNGVILFKFSHINKIHSRKLNFKIKKRVGMQIGALPEIFFYPASLTVIALTQTGVNLADVAIFVSYFGMLMFILSNFYNYFGVEINEYMNMYIKKNGFRGIIYILMIAFSILLMISMPVGLILNLIRFRELEFVSLVWIFAASFISAALLFNFWFTSFSIKLKNTFVSIFIPNCLMFLALIVYFLIDFNYAIIFSICYLIRLIYQIKLVIRLG